MSRITFMYAVKMLHRRANYIVELGRRAFGETIDASGTSEEPDELNGPPFADVTCRLACMFMSEEMESYLDAHDEFGRRISQGSQLLTLRLERDAHAFEDGPIPKEHRYFADLIFRADGEHSPFFGTVHQWNGGSVVLEIEHIVGNKYPRIIKHCSEGLHDAIWGLARAFGFVSPHHDAMSLSRGEFVSKLREIKRATTWLLVTLRDVEPGYDPTIEPAPTTPSPARGEPPHAAFTNVAQSSEPTGSPAGRVKTKSRRGRRVETNPEKDRRIAEVKKASGQTNAELAS
ncbi:MAG: hypothetical protein KGM43_03065, partial [Planctomycetota bacterium]|nr:hypothetical protein [Planctomycetota bacterium]